MKTVLQIIGWVGVLFFGWLTWGAVEMAAKDPLHFQVLDLKTALMMAGGVLFSVIVILVGRKIGGGKKRSKRSASPLPLGGLHL
jgi:hypothetical protein